MVLFVKCQQHHLESACFFSSSSNSSPNPFLLRIKKNIYCSLYFECISVTQRSKAYSPRWGYVDTWKPLGSKALEEVHRSWGVCLWKQLWTSIIFLPSPTTTFWLMESCLALWWDENLLTPNQNKLCFYQLIASGISKW